MPDFTALFLIMTEWGHRMRGRLNIVADSLCMHTQPERKPGMSGARKNRRTLELRLFLILPKPFLVSGCGGVYRKTGTS